MLTTINMDLVVIVLDLMDVHNFHGQTVNEVKILLFLGLVIVFLCMLIIEKKILVLDKVVTQI